MRAVSGLDEVGSAASEIGRHAKAGGIGTIGAPWMLFVAVPRVDLVRLPSSPLCEYINAGTDLERNEGDAAAEPACWRY